MGNYLGDYFESILCAKKCDMHYMTVAKIWEPKHDNKASPFLDHLPSIIAAPSQSMTNIQPRNMKETMKKNCPCLGSCHERSNALWTTGREVIRTIFINSIDHHLEVQKATETIVRNGDLSSLPPGSILPLIPEVAIHYRCGDNFVGHYGFIPFSVIISKIPKDAQLIYVLAESRTRKTSTKPHLMKTCQRIFEEFYSILRKTFLNARILIQRGGDMYVDLARLTYSKVSVCSVSTFCLWPAMVSNGTAYFPKTSLIAGEDTSIDLGFQWINDPRIVLGAPYDHGKSSSLVQKLME